MRTPSGRRIPTHFHRWYHSFVRGKGKEPDISPQEELVFSKLVSYDIIAQRYGMNPFDIPKIFSPSQLDKVVEMINVEGMYQREKNDEMKEKANANKRGR